MTTREVGLLLCCALLGCSPAAQPGERVSAIYGGTKDSEHLAVGGIVSDFASGCTATLIGRRTVLTAAHCVCGVEPYVTPQLPLTFTDSRGMAYQAEKAVVPPLLTGGFWERDLAVVRLAAVVPGIVPSLLTTSAPVVGEPITVVGRGWGGLSEYPGVTRVGTNTVGKVGAHHIEFSNTAGAATCQGDSGGPSYATRDGEEQLISVHSAGTAGKCGVPYGSALDTRVDVYRAWIAQQAQGDLYAGEPIDTTPPEVTIDAPGDGDQVPASFTLKARATDDVGVVKVTLSLDGTLQQERAKPPFEFPVSELSDSSHTLRVEAHDAEMNVGSAEITVSLQPGLAFGEACSDDAQCAGGLCRGGLCTVGCSSLKACPDGFECRDLACAPASSGCSVQPGRAPARPAATLLLLLLLLVGIGMTVAHRGLHRPPRG